MKNKFLTIFLILILIGIFIFLGSIFFGKIDYENLTSPVGNNLLQKAGLQKITSPSDGRSTPTPIQYNFDKSTDLQKELDTISPAVLDSDFNNLKTITSQL